MPAIRACGVALFLCCVLAWRVHAAEEWLNGRVVSVTDGDTAVVDVGGRSLRVRFYGVDAPEHQNRDWPAQPYSRRATTFMRELIGHRQVRIRLIGERTHAREVGEVFVGGHSASREILRAGLAWWNDKYAPQDHVLEQLQADARAARRGLWRDPSPVAPWIHRARHRRLTP